MKTKELEFRILGQTLLLSSQKAIYWKENRSLLLSDVHLGKAGHFRKAGIPVPSKIHHDDLRRLNQLVERYCPEHVYLLGDLFHSELNSEWDDFQRWRTDLPHLQVSLVAGNHDIIPPAYYSGIKVAVCEQVGLGPFTLTHRPVQLVEGYNLAGHTHPGIHLTGRSRQGIKLPCFYFGKFGGVLPAFGNFTGSVAIKPARHDRVFAVTPSSVLAIQ